MRLRLGVLLLGLSAIGASQTSWAFPVEIGLSPYTTLDLTLKAIRSARESISINIYEFTSEDIQEAVSAALERGIQVQILEEGQPVGGFSDNAREIQRLVLSKMDPTQKKDFFVMTSRGKNIKRRFRFDHGKYIVVDHKSLLIGSENFSPTGQARRGSEGNRGWEVWVHNPQIARAYERVFSGDTDQSFGDIVEANLFLKELAEYKKKKSHLIMNLAGAFGLNVYSSKEFGDLFFDEAEYLSGVDLGILPFYRTSPRIVSSANQKGVIFPEGGAFSKVKDAFSSVVGNRRSEPQSLEMDALEVTKVTSPDSSLPGLLNLLGNAKHRIDVQLMTFDSCWGGCQNGESPLFRAVIDAAKRGVKVRALLNDERVFSAKAKLKNHHTATLLNEIAEQEGLDLEARVANVKEMGVRIIHNKGALIDGRQTLVSSINWNQNSVENNREAAIVLQSTEINDFYTKQFDQDWDASEYLD